jgi:O-antigen/teichoic acid export membrane protein
MLGGERYGVYRTLLDIFAYLTLLDLGFGAALGASLAGAQGKGDSQQVRELISAGLRRYIRIGLGMLLVSAVLVAALPRLIHVRQLSSREMMTAGLISMTPILFIPISTYRALLEARQEGYIVQLIQISQSLLATILLLITARLGWRLPGQAGATSAALILAQLSTFFFATRFRGVEFGHARQETVSLVQRLQWPSLVYVITGRIGLLSDNVVISSMLAPALVAPFYLTQRVVTVATTQLQQVGSATWAGMVELVARGMKREFREKMLDLTSMVSGGALAVLAPIAAFNQHMIRVWVGSSNDAGAGIVLLSCVNAWFLALFTLWTWPVTGLGLISKLLPTQILSTLVNLVVSIVATKYIGLAGPLIGTLAGFAGIASWGFPRVLAQELGVEPRSLWASAALQLCWGLPYLGALWIISHSMAPMRTVPLGCASLLAVFGGIALWWTFGLSKAARSHWRHRLSFVFAS